MHSIFLILLRTTYAVVHPNLVTIVSSVAFCCAPLITDISNFVVYGMLQLRQFNFICGASMYIDVLKRVLLGFNYGYWILHIELDCFCALVLLVFVPLGLVQAWMGLVIGWLAKTSAFIICRYRLHCCHKTVGFTVPLRSNYVDPELLEFEIRLSI